MNSLINVINLNIFFFHSLPTIHEDKVFEKIPVAGQYRIIKGRICIVLQYDCEIFIFSLR